MTGGVDLASGRMKRFYEDVAVAQHTDGFAVLLDGRAAKTREGAVLATSAKRLAEAVAEEWRAAGESIVFEAMPLTRLLFTAIDKGATARREWTNDVIDFLKSDLLCYRAEASGTLRARQTAVWDPYLDWARGALGIALETTTAMTAVAQPGEALAAARQALDRAAPPALLGVRAASVSTGSAVLALALWENVFPADTVFAASRLDETFQAERWGVDAEAEAREKRIEAEFMDVARFLMLLED